MSDAAEHIGGIVAGDVVWGIDVAAPRAAMLPTIRFTLGGGGGGGNYLPARAKRRVRKEQTTAYQQKIAALRKQLDQDVPITCWSDRIREESDGTLAVSFGSGISKPRTISIASLNIQGCKHLEEEKEQGKEKGADKLELLVGDFKKDRREVLLLQHTGALVHDHLEIPAAKGTGKKYFVHGVKQENNHIHGGVGIMLSRRAAAFAWKEAGSPEPIGSTLLSGTARFMSLVPAFDIGSSAVADRLGGGARMNE